LVTESVAGAEVRSTKNRFLKILKFGRGWKVVNFRFGRMSQKSVFGVAFISGHGYILTNFIDGISAAFFVENVWFLVKIYCVWCLLSWFFYRCTYAYLLH
jgi:hypothetical protein